MIKISVLNSILILLTAGGVNSAASLYGSYQASASHNCNDPACTSATDIITATGSNTLQGASNLTATLMEDALGNLQPGPITITSLSDGSEIFGILSISFDPTVAPPAYRTPGTVQFTGGTGLYAGFTANEIISGGGLFTGPTSAIGTLVFTPEPESWSLMALATLGFGALRRFRHR
jgi:hypothetical protein